MRVTVQTGRKMPHLNCYGTVTIEEETVTVSGGLEGLPEMQGLRSDVRGSCVRRIKGVKCPYCNEQDTKVIDSRPADDNSSIRRRRQCEACGKRFTTYEKLETMPFMVIKKDRSRETYDRSKIEAGILHSCHKRPVSIQQINYVIDEIENKIFSMEEKEVETTVIGELVMKKLKQLDEVAYVRFASVYREFKDVNTFMEELGKLLKSEKGDRTD